MSIHGIEEQVQKCNFVVGYVPLADEVTYESILPVFSIQKPNMYISQSNDTDPALWSKKCIHTANASLGCVLVPGVLFDMYGNRKGRGGGWYDRFLSYLPQQWIRIGVCKKSAVSLTQLKTNPWDVPMHGLLIYDVETNAWKICGSL